MARTAQTVRELVDEDPGMADAIETVLERSDGDRSAVMWADVNDSLSSGQWGRLIEKGILVEGDDDGFRVADADAVREELGLATATDDGAGTSAAEAASTADESGDEPPGDSSWSKWDKAAGLVALMLFPGYYFNSIRSTVGGAVDLVLGPVDSMLPFYVVILLLAVLTGLYSTLLQANLMDMDRISYYQGKMQDLQERQEAAKERGDDAELEAIREEQMEQMGENLGMFKEQFRPMVWTMLLIIPVFLWMYWKLRGGHISGGEELIVLPLMGQVNLLNGSFGPMPAWIVWYFLCSLSFSQLIRKSLNVQTTPTGT
jgi:uncharacterized membrane protein (DUF106 family)